MAKQDYSAIGTWPTINRVTLAGYVGQVRMNSYPNVPNSKFLDIFLGSRTLKRAPNGDITTQPEWHHLILYGSSEVMKFAASVQEKKYLLIEGHIQYKDPTTTYPRPDRLMNVPRYADIVIDYWTLLSPPTSEFIPPLDGPHEVTMPILDVVASDQTRDDLIEERSVRQEYRP